MNQAPDWRLGCQTYTFNRFTLFEAIDKTVSLGLRCIEAYPGQRLSIEKRDVVFNPHSPEATLDEVRAKLDSAGVTLVNFGCVNLPNNETECRAVFDFARKMGIETIVSEPPSDALGLVNDLCQEYTINVAIHNHPAPSIYWNPDAVVAACAGRSAYMGACADTGHWIRSGLDPLEAMKKLEGRIISFHLKDVDRHAPEAEDVPLGTGVARIRALLDEAKRQRLQAVFSIEYEASGNDDPFSEVGKCAEYFGRYCAEG